MTRPHQSSRGGSNRARRRAEAAVTARRRRIWVSTIAATILAVVGLVLGLHFATGTARAAPPAAPATGRGAPGGTFTLLSGKTLDVASLRGRPALLWFVTTWCSSCQVGTQSMAANIAKFDAAGVPVYEIEVYRDLDQSGPSMTQFSQALAGSELANPDWNFAVSSQALTQSYDPQSYLDIYYLLDANGQVAYVNSSPGATMGDLLAAIRSLR